MLIDISQLIYSILIDIWGGIKKTVHWCANFLMTYKMSYVIKKYYSSASAQTFWSPLVHGVYAGQHTVCRSAVVSNCKLIWAATWQNQQNECAPSEDSDQPGHPPSLIRVFAVRMKKPWVLSYPLSAQRRLWSNWVDAQADLSLRWAHTHFVGFVMLWLISWMTYWMSIEIQSCLLIGILYYCTSSESGYLNIFSSVQFYKPKWIKA